MDGNLQSQSAQRQTEAMHLYEECGIRALLAQQLGTPHLVGSVALGLIVRREIDVFLELEPSNAVRLLSLAPRLQVEINRHGHWLQGTSFADYHRPGNCIGKGLYLSLDVKHGVSGQSWRVAIWGWTQDDLRQALEQRDRLNQKLAGANRELVLQIKAALHDHADHHKAFSSTDIYAYALDEPKGSLAGFKARLGLD